METPAWAGHRAERVGIALALAVEQGGVEQARPGFGFNIKDIVKAASVATATVAILKNQSAIGIIQELRVGAALFVLPGHREPLEGGDVSGFFGAEIDERDGMHVA